MDAEFLQLTVNDALLEALTATAIANPTDKIDYLGNYLVQYVNRNRKQRFDEANAKTAKALADEFEKEEKVKENSINDEKKQEENRKNNCEKTIEIICETAANKKQVMDVICEVCADYLKVPSVYIAERNKSEETESLNYLSANSNQSFMVGKQLIKFSDDGDDKPERQGISFDVFNIPETEEEEEDTPEEDEDGNPIEKPPKPPLKLPPLIVENVMRNKDVKFFGIPKLGSVAILPFSYDSTDHDAGCNVEIEIPQPPEEAEAEAEDENKEENEDGDEVKGEEKKEVKEPVELKPITKYNANTVKKEFIIVMDTIGNYRKFQKAEIEWLDMIGIKLMSAFERLDKIQFDHQVIAFKEAIEHDYENSMTKLITDAESAETKVLEAIEKRFNVAAEEEKEQDEQEEGEEGEGKTEEKKEDTKINEPSIELDIETEEPHELLQPYRTAQAVEKVWKNKFVSDEMFGLIMKLSSIEIPPQPVILSLMETLAKFLDLPTNFYKDLFNNTSWEVIKAKLLAPDLKTAIESYDCSKELILSSADSSIESIKGVCDSNGLFDSATYSAVLPSEGLCALLRPIYIWLQKALTAREAAIAFYQEAKEISLEKSKA